MTEVFTDDGENELMNYNKELWMQEQINCHDVQTEVATSSFQGNKDDTVKIMNILSDLGEDLRKQHFDKDRKETIIRRIQQGNFLVKQVFEENHEGKETKEKVRYIVELLERQCQMVTEIMKALKKSDELRNKLDALKQENFEKRRESRKLMLEIKEKNEAKQQIIRDPETTQSIKDFDVIMQKIIIARHTLQGLVLGSGIDWAADPQLLEIVLKLGETLDFK